MGKDKTLQLYELFDTKNIIRMQWKECLQKRFAAENIQSSHQLTISEVDGI